MYLDATFILFVPIFFHSHGNKGPCTLYSGAPCLCPIQPGASVSANNKRHGHPAGFPAPTRALPKTEAFFEQEAGTDQRTKAGLTSEVMLNKLD